MRLKSEMLNLKLFRELKIRTEIKFLKMKVRKMIMCDDDNNINNNNNTHSICLF